MVIGPAGVFYLAHLDDLTCPDHPWGSYALLPFHT
jgi:hypothetical protein